MSAFSENMRRIRFEHHMTQEEFAEMLGTTKQNISRYESGAVSPKISTAAIIAEKLGVSLSELSGEVLSAEAEKRLQSIREKLLRPFNSDEWKQLSNKISELPANKRRLPNYALAAYRATETLIKYRISFAPISPLPILKAIPGVIVISFSEIAALTRIDRNDVIEIIDAENKDALTLVREYDGQLRYIVAYNMRAPFYVLQYALACELGHIVMLHDGSKDDAVRAAEVECFANYFLFPRQLLRAGLDAGIPHTVGNIGRAMGCYEECVDTIKSTPGIAVPKELNRIVKNQFAEYVKNYVEIQKAFSLIDNTPIADLGKYMENYEE